MPDGGTITVRGQQMDSYSPALATQQGIAIVHQHPAVLPDMTVAENIRVAVPAAFLGDRGNQLEAMREMLLDVGLTAHLDDRVGGLTVAQKHLLELAKALVVKPSLLILDEPTAPLGQAAVSLLFDRVRKAAQTGTAVVYITHRLAEVRELASQVTVLRDGKVRGSGRVEEISDDQLLALIVGRQLDSTFPAKRADSAAGPAALTVEGLSGFGFNDVSFTARRGEILGVSGIVGNGQSAVLRALAGLESFDGSVRIGDRVHSSKQLRRASAFLPSDRHSEGLMMSLSVRENTAVSALPSFARGPLLSRRTEVRGVDRELSSLAVKAPSREATVSALSGGNQQKVVLARTLMSQPALLVADEPTQGVDVGARAEIYRILRQVAAAGAGVIIVSSDTRELEGLCDRVLVFSSGQVVTELRGDRVTEDAIAHAMLTSTRRRRPAETETARPASGGRGARILTWLRQASRGDYVAPVVLALAIIALAVYTQSHNSRFLSSFNLTSLTVLIAATAFISFGQECVIVTGGIDLSVGPLAGLVVVIGSFFENSGHSAVVIIAGFGIMIGACAAVGILNGSMVRFARFTPIVATLVTYIALQGVSLVLRPFQGGYISFSILNAINHTAGPVAIAFGVAVVVAIVMERALRRSRWGRSLRAIGSDPAAAFRLGVRPGVTVIGAYVASSLFACVGGVLLMAQIGVGDPTQGVNYTLASVTAVVLGGTSIFGGRGSFIGALFGAILVEQLLNVTTFLQLSQAWQYWFQGALVMVAVGIYTQARTRTGGQAPLTT
jgi:ribose transport system ATP-binding protein